MTKRFLCIILAALMLIAIIPLSASALARQETAQSEGMISFRTAAFSDSLGLIKDDLNRRIYFSYKAHAGVLAEHGGETALTLDRAVLGDISVTVSSGEDVKAALAAKLGSAIDFTGILNCLVLNCPYEMYWYDKTVGLKMKYTYTYTDTNATVTTLTTMFAVSKDYQADDYNPSAPTITTDLGRVKAAIAEAKLVVEANKDKSDMEKLAAYRDYICSHASYNSATQANYGDPWQLIYVFDGDSTTNVLCEGYVKAFQYLCNLTEFDGNVEVYSVTGIMSGGTGSGNHMWNIVVTDKGNYLVDITNSDKSTVGEAGELFMNAKPKSGNSLGYVFEADGTLISYVYNDVSVLMYSREVLALGLKKGNEGYGDPSGDGKISAQDAALILQYNVKLIDSFKNPTGADVSGDGKVSAQDAALILQYNVQLIDSFPAENKA